MLKYLVSLILGAFTIICATQTYAQLPYINDANQNVNIKDDGSIPLLGTEIIPTTERLEMLNIAGSPEWQRFIDQHGSWSVYIDKTTGMPHRGFGKPIEIPGYEKITKDNIQAASMAFITQNKELLKLNPDNLKFLSASLVNKRWYVSFVQLHKGIEVLQSKVDLRIHSTGKVTSFIDDYYNGIDIPTQPFISASIAQNSAKVGLNIVDKQDKIMSANELYILPVRINGKVSYRLAYMVNIEHNSANTKYTAYVDAASSEVLWRRKTTMDAITSVEVKAGIRWEDHYCPISNEPLSNLYVKAGTQRYTSDRDGKVQFDITQKLPLTFTLEGPFAKVVMKDGSTMAFKDSVSNSEQKAVLLDDSNSTIYERTMFYHANYIHNYFKDIDTAYNYMDYQLLVTFDQNYNNGGPNANSDPTTGNITFFGTGKPDNYFSENPGILYHEYGHSVNAKLYQSKGRKNGMINRACNEAIADVTCAMIFDDPYIGRGAFADTIKIPNIRNLKNTMKYPFSMTGEEHNDGQILSGAFWDLREMTNLDYMRKLTYFVRYSLADDADNGIAFSEWFFETILADDDDGDITNGTPHLAEIVKSFNNHNIGTGLLMSQSFSHRPLQDTRDTVNPYNVVFTLKGMEQVGSKVLNPRVAYSTDSFISTKYVPATENSGTFTAQIPAQKSGTIVKYYMDYTESLSKTQHQKSAGKTTLQPFEFIIGYNMAFFDDFELDRGWKVGSIGDTATKGKWERAVPEAISMTIGSNKYVQLGEDYTENGSKCYVTGPKVGTSWPAIQNNMPNGRTSFVSPTIDISKLQRPLLKYHYVFSNVLVVSDATKMSKFIVHVSSDGGYAWIKVDSSSTATNDWKSKVFDLSKYIKLTDQFRIKYTVLAYTSSQGNLYAFSDAMVDDVEILSLNDEQVAIGVEEPIQTATELSLAVYPNPVTTSTNISYYLPKADYTELKLYSLNGSEIAVIDKGYNNSGYKSINFDRARIKAASGTYFLRLRLGNDIISRMLIIE